MSIGLYDADMVKYLLVPFNLELMKLSTYYKQKREMVLLAKEFDTSRNSQIFYIKDWDDGDFPSSLIDTNVHYLGRAFSGNNYIPLDMDIERCRPDTSIYSIMAKDICSTKTTENIFNAMSHGEHCRLSLDGKTIWPQYMCQFHNLETTKLIMFHDYDLGKVDGAFEEIQKILSLTKRHPLIGLKFAPQLNNPADLLKWSSLPSHNTFYSMAFNGVLSQNDFYQWCAQGHKSSSYTQLEYNITPTRFSMNDFTEDFLRLLLRQVIISRSYRLKISLIYSTDFISDKYSQQLLDLLNFYQHSMFSGRSDAAFIRDIQNDTVYDFAKKSVHTYGKYPKMLNREDMRNLFNYARRHYPIFFKELYELSYLKLKEEIQ